MWAILSLMECYQGDDFFKALFHGMHEGVAVYKVINEGEDFVFADINPAGECVSHVHREEILGRSIRDVFPGVDQIGLSDALKHAYKTGESVRLPLAYYSDGRVHEWVDNFVFKAGDHCVGAVYSDVTEQQDALQALRASEHRFREVMETIPLAVEELNADGELEYVNHAYERMFHVDARDVVGKRPDAFFVGSAQEFTSMLQTLRERMDEPCPWFGKNRRANGEIMDVRVDWNYRRDAQGGVIGFVAIITDITETLQMEQQLRQRQKMEAIGELAGGIAHDFNNQLAVVLGYSNLLENRLENEELKQFAHEISTSARRSAELTRQLLAYARSAPGCFFPLDLHEIIKEVIHILSRTIDKQIQIEAQLDAETSWVNGDAGQLQNAILNIGINARDAMPDGGTLRVATENVHISDAAFRSRESDVPPGKYIRLSVQDTGIGIDPELQEKIFEPFFTTKGPGVGTGMGLASVYGTMQTHKGTIRMDSVVGRGTTMMLYLPVEDKDKEVVMLNLDEEPEQATGHVLVIDDEPQVREMTRETLESSGFSVTLAAGAVDAIQRFRENAAGFDVVLLDMIMPEMSGIEVLKALLEVKPDVRVLLASGYSRKDDAEQALQMGAMGFLQKPFEASTLVSHLSELLQS